MTSVIASKKYDVVPVPQNKLINISKCPVEIILFYGCESTDLDSGHIWIMPCACAAGLKQSMSMCILGRYQFFTKQ